MKKENFNQLLTDLYTAYNPEYLEFVPQLVEKYSRMEFSAIDMVLLKYNRKTASYYDPKKDTDEYKHNLIKEYSSGNRILKDFKVQNENNLIKKEEENKIIEDNKKIEENINNKLNSIKEEFSEKEKELIKTYELKIQELIKKVGDIKPIKQSIYDDIDIKIISNYTENEVKLPNKEYLIGLGVGARIVTSTKDGTKMIGLKILDILYDCVSDVISGKPTIEIIIDRG